MEQILLSDILYTENIDELRRIAKDLFFDVLTFRGYYAEFKAICKNHGYEGSSHHELLNYLEDKLWKKN
jgi:hypothetical protein